MPWSGPMKLVRCVGRVGGQSSLLLGPKAKSSAFIEVGRASERSEWEQLTFYLSKKSRSRSRPPAVLYGIAHSTVPSGLTTTSRYGGFSFVGS